RRHHRRPRQGQVGPGRHFRRRRDRAEEVSFAATGSSPIVTARRAIWEHPDGLRHFQEHADRENFGAFHLTLITPRYTRDTSKQSPSQGERAGVETRMKALIARFWNDNRG